MRRSTSSRRGKAASSAESEAEAAAAAKLIESELSSPAQPFSVVANNVNIPIPGINKQQARRLQELVFVAQAHNWQKGFDMMVTPVGLVVLLLYILRPPPVTSVCVLNRAGHVCLPKKP